MKNSRVAIYVRCSTAQQNLDAQIAELTRYAEARQWQIVERFEDHAHSGSTTSRPSLNKLVSAMRRRKFDLVLVFALDRLGRNTSHLLSLVEEMESLGVALVSLREAIDLSTPVGRMMVTILSALASFERELIRERVVLGIENARRNGKKLGRPKSISEQEIIDLRSQGWTYSQISDHLGISPGSISAAIKNSAKNTR